MLKRFLLTVLILISFSTMAGAYAGDTHYYIRFATALLVGFDWDDAHLIASADYMIDRNKSTHAEKNPAKKHNKVNWHAFERTEERFFELWARVLGESDPELQLIELGQFLHFAADWEPHGVFGDRLGHGMATIMGRDPDSLGTDIMNNRRMIRQTMDFMMEFRASTGRPVGGGGDPDRALAELFLELSSEPIMDDLYMINSPRWKTWGVRGKKGRVILARNHLLVEELISKWGKERPDLKVPADFTPGDPEKGLPPPIGMSYRKNGDIVAVYGVEVELLPEFDGGDFNAALEERYEERVEPEVVDELQQELHGGGDPDLFNIVGTQVLDAGLKKSGWLVTVQVANFGVGHSAEGRLELHVVNIHTEETVGHLVYQLPRLKGGQKIRKKILVPSEGKPERDVVIGVTLDGPDLLADDNDDWFMPWDDELEDQPAPKKKKVQSRGQDSIALLGNPKMWVEGAEGVVVVLSALVSGGDSSHRLGAVELRLVGRDESHTFTIDEDRGVVWFTTLDLEQKTMPAKTFLWVPINSDLCTALKSASLVPEHFEVTVSGDKVEPVTKRYPLDPHFIAELREACGVDTAVEK